MHKTAGHTKKKPQSTIRIRAWAQFHQTPLGTSHTVSAQKYLSQIEQQHFADLMQQDVTLDPLELSIWSIRTLRSLLFVYLFP